jgi:hypothetical protein
VAQFRATYLSVVGAMRRIRPEETDSGRSLSLSGLEFSSGVFRGAGVSRHRFDCVDGQAVSLDEIGARGVPEAPDAAKVRRVRERRGRGDAVDWPAKSVAKPNNGSAARGAERLPGRPQLTYSMRAVARAGEQPRSGLRRRRPLRETRAQPVAPTIQAAAGCRP